jgi:hypothetical protein
MHEKRADGTERLILPPGERALADHAIPATPDPPCDPVTGGPYPRG